MKRGNLTSLSYEEMRALELTHVCGECDAPLVTRWSPQKGCHELRCGENIFHTGYQKVMSYSTARARGFPIPLEIEQQLQRKEERKMSEQTSEEKSREEVRAKVRAVQDPFFSTKPPNQVEKLPVIYEASNGRVVPREVALEAVRYAESIGLVPELGHICLYFGKPWVTIDGWYYRFRKKHPHGRVITRPLGSNERSAAKVEEGLHAWVAEAYEEEGRGLLSQGYGYAREGEKPLAKGSAVEPQWPWRMAEKRAEEDCLRKAVPLELETPGEEE